MKNYLQLEVGEKARGLKFNMRTLDFIADLTGKDPFSFKPDAEDLKGVSKYAQTIFHAALLSNCASKKEVPDFAEEEVKEWFAELTPGDVALIIDMINAPAQMPANGEVSKDTQ